MKTESVFEASFNACKGKKWKQVIPWTGQSRNADLNLFIEEVRAALMQPDRDGNSVFSSLVYGTKLPFWEGEEKTIDQLALLGIITDKEYKQREETNI